jgi:rubrerythrin
MQRGADILRQLDQFDDSQTSKADLDAQLEAAIEARRADVTRPQIPISKGDDDIEAMLAARRREHQEKSAGFCPQCGGTVHQSDRFCPKCGTSL